MATSARAWAAVTLGAVVIIGTAHGATVRRGHDWGGDFSMYIAHGCNIAEGRAYADTGYIYNPDEVVGPKAYPPVLPLLLAPIYKTLGLHLVAMKMLMCGLLALALLGLWAGARDELPPAFWPVLTIAVGALPFLWDFKDQVLSDIPFLAGLMGSFWALGRLERAADRRRRLIWAAAAGVMISLAVGTRTVGVILIGAVALSQLIRTRRISWVLCLAAGVPTAYWLAQSALLGGTGDYLSVFSIDAGVIWPNVTNYWAELYPPWANGVPGIAWSAALVLLGLIIVVGYAAAVARGVTAREAFVPLYAGVLLIWPHYQGLRMLIPLIPLAGLYGCLGARRVAELGVFRSRRWILPAAGVLLAVGYAEAYSRRIRDYSPTIGGGVAKAETRELFQAVGERTAPDAVCVFFKPRVLALYTGRRASACHEPRPGEDLTDYFREIGATHLILGPWRQQSPEDFVAARRERLPVVYSNADFIVFDLAAVVLRGASTSP